MKRKRRTLNLKMQASSMHGAYTYATLIILPRFLQSFFMVPFQSTFDVKKKRGRKRKR